MATTEPAGGSLSPTRATMSDYARSLVYMFVATMVLVILDYEISWFPAIGIGVAVGCIIGRNESS